MRCGRCVVRIERASIFRRDEPMTMSGAEASGQSVLAAKISFGGMCLIGLAAARVDFIALHVRLTGEGPFDFKNYG